jgi:hypothetical protein
VKMSALPTRRALVNAASFPSLAFFVSVRRNGTAQPAQVRAVAQDEEEVVGFVGGRGTAPSFDAADHDDGVDQGPRHSMKRPRLSPKNEEEGRPDLWPMDRSRGTCRDSDDDSSSNIYQAAPEGRAEERVAGTEDPAPLAGMVEKAGRASERDAADLDSFDIDLDRLLSIDGEADSRIPDDDIDALAAAGAAIESVHELEVAAYDDDQDDVEPSPAAPDDAELASSAPHPQGFVAIRPLEPPSPHAAAAAAAAAAAPGAGAGGRGGAGMSAGQGAAVPYLLLPSVPAHDAAAAARDAAARTQSDDDLSATSLFFRLDVTDLRQVFDPHAANVRLRELD